MVRPLLCLVLLAAGGALVIRGLRDVVERGRVADVATRFLEAVRDGDRPAAEALLDGRLRTGVAGRDWQAAEGAIIRLHRVEMRGRSASVEARVELAGYELRPRLRLCRDSEGAWRITGIEGARADPFWVDRLEHAFADPRAARPR